MKSNDWPAATAGSSTVFSPVLRLNFQSEPTARRYDAQVYSYSEVMTQRIGTPA